MKCFYTVNDFLLCVVLIDDVVLKQLKNIVMRWPMVLVWACFNVWYGHFTWSLMSMYIILRVICYSTTVLNDVTSCLLGDHNIVFYLRLLNEAHTVYITPLYTD